MHFKTSMWSIMLLESDGSVMEDAHQLALAVLQAVFVFSYFNPSSMSASIRVSLRIEHRRLHPPVILWLLGWVPSNAYS